MAYAFNDDKSKVEVYTKDEIDNGFYTKDDVYTKDEIDNGFYTKTELNNKIKIVTGSVTVTAETIKTVDISLDSAIDMSKVVVLSCEQTTGVSDYNADTYFNSWKIYNNWSYPYYRIDLTNHKITIGMYNWNNTSKTLKYRLAYMVLD